MSNLYMTNKQIQVMKVILKGNRDEAGNWSPVDLDQLLERIPYETTKASMQFTIRYLIAKGCITKGQEKRRSYTRAIYTPTEQGRAMIQAEDQHWLEQNPLARSGT
jgi:predicted transcriptional regulator